MPERRPPASRSPRRTAESDPQRLAVGFVAVLRRAGLVVPFSRVAMFVDALGTLDLARRPDVYWAGRSTLVGRPEDRAVFDDAFSRFWEGAPPPRRLSGPAPIPVALEAEAEDPVDGPPGDLDDAERDVEVVRYSATETLRQKDFAAYTEVDFAEAHRLLIAMRLQGSGRLSRRLQRAQGGPTGHPDLRRTVRRSLRTAGEPVDLAWRQTTTRPRRLVLLCDVSGSMEAYSRALLRFAHAAVTGRARVEVFALGTRLTRLSRQLRTHDPDAALAAAARAVPDWSGGTRLGEGIRRFNDEWGIRGLARGATVVILSDGWDRGDPDALAEQMGRLHRVAHRIVWVNPLKAAPGYAPLARGMAAALPWVDAFIEGHSIIALERLAHIVSGRPLPVPAALP